MKSAKTIEAPLRKFSGFPAGSLQFFRRLRRNNHRDWFLKHKAEYESALVVPMTALVLDISDRLQDAGLALAPNRKSPVLRIYRDIRFSNDKTPYKTLISASLRHQANKMEAGMFYASFSDKECFAAAGFWKPEREQLMSFRQRIASNPAAFERVYKSIRKAGYDFHWKSALQRLPRGYQEHAGAPSEKYLKLTSYVVVRDISAKEAESPKLAADLAKFALQMRPLLEFGWWS